MNGDGNQDLVVAALYGRYSVYILFLSPNGDTVAISLGIFSSNLKFFLGFFFRNAGSECAEDSIFSWIPTIRLLSLSLQRFEHGWRRRACRRFFVLGWGVGRR